MEQNISWIIVFYPINSLVLQSSVSLLKITPKDQLQAFLRDSITMYPLDLHSPSLFFVLYLSSVARLPSAERVLAYGKEW